MKGRTLVLFTVGLTAIASTAKAEEVSLSKDLMPIFARSCTGCHQREGGNPHAVEAGVYLEKKEDLLKPKRGLIIAGKPEASFLLTVLNPPKDMGSKVKTMPPARSDKPKLSKEEIQKIYDWIKAGARDN